MAQYAVVENNVVVNIVEWDGVTPWTPGIPAITQVFPLNGVVCSPGWLWNNGAPTNPNPPPVVVVTQQQIAPPLDLSVLTNHGPAIQALALAVAAAAPTLTAAQLQAAFSAAWKALPTSLTANATV